ncbi:hypothetical protein CFC21_017767 [Triticum aestivum]|uniref:Uncharacterized protein n=3 Tax=Triticum TaxID=4564 RepID=A0A9R1R986_TRITD|nr:hypothetical protein CFC21_017767 [Triticum aestivum]VAH32964.1 unnamed protein product [Triticum turgidum subsp. durum]
MGGRLISLPDLPARVAAAAALTRARALFNSGCELHPLQRSSLRSTRVRIKGSGGRACEGAAGGAGRGHPGRIMKEREMQSYIRTASARSPGCITLIEYCVKKNDRVELITASYRSYLADKHCLMKVYFL